MSFVSEMTLPAGGLLRGPLRGGCAHGYAVPMTSGESPMIARRRVRLALREAREALDLTQSDVAEAMEWSLSKVIRIEGGEVSISPNDLRPLLAYLRIKDRKTIDGLIADAKMSRVRQRRFWWQEAPFREHLTPGTQRLIEFEREAVAIRYFAIYIIPGVLQTKLFAQAVLQQWQFGLSPEDIKVRLDTRMRRRNDMLTRTDAPTLSVLLDESLVWRPYGGRAVLIDQLTDLHRLASEGRLALRVVPFSMEAPLPTYGAFDLMYLKEDGDDENAVLYREFEFTDEIVEDRNRAAQYHTRFDELWHASMTEADTIDLLSRRLTELAEQEPTESP
jgi:transcriptional regulator with XRE-family HTH domain